MQNQVFPWQDVAWKQLQQMRERLPHAVLLHGTEGTGKIHFAECFARSLLCEAPLSTGAACGGCSSCGWFDQYSHPDFRRVRPEALEDDGEAAGGDEADGAGDAGGKKAAKTKAPSKEIKIDQIRALADFMNVTTHRQGMRVIALYPAEALNTAASNALLKMLEEPPPMTMFLLVSNSIDRLLPTILSRCRKFALPMPSQADALDWLKKQSIKDPEVWLAERGGAPLAAMAASQSGEREVMDELLGQLARPGIEGSLKTAERLQKTPVAELVTCLQRWLYDLNSVKFTGKIRYYPRYRKEISALAERVNVSKLLPALKAVSERRAIAEHPLSAKLFIEDMLLDYSKLFS
ncbi:DNA polymerase III subunit delta' [soil metagenome]